MLVKIFKQKKKGFLLNSLANLKKMIHNKIESLTKSLLASVQKVRKTKFNT